MTRTGARGGRDGQPEAPGSADGADLRIALLGGFGAVAGGTPIPAGAWARRKAQAVVKLLALAPGHALHREEVLESLWPESDPAAARNSLNQALHAARKALGPAAPGLRVVGERLVLTGRPLWVDVAAFEAAAANAGRTRQPADFEAALALYTGDLLPEDRYEDWAVGRRETLRVAYHALLETLAGLHEVRNDFPAAVAALERLIADEPTIEEAHASLMRLLARVGRRDRALRQYAQLREILRRDLDAEPGPSTQRLHAAILAGELNPAATPAPASAPPLAAQSPVVARRSVLPRALTSFIGRAREVRAIMALLTDPGGSPLVTLTGVGGVGKTRLALTVAIGLADGPTYPDGVRVIELAPIADPALVPQELANALGLPEDADRPSHDVLVSALADRATLLVLDNCEHVIDACAGLAATLLGGCPRLRLLATSREALRVPGEATWPVPTLSLPPDGEPSTPAALLGASEAARLFVERAALVQPDFALTERNMAAVAAICRRLDGLPLALELAAGRVATLAPQQLAARLDDALRLLTGGARTVPSRQQTLRATLDWSHALLDGPERALLRRLAPFAGGWALEAAEAVGSGGEVAEARVLDLLASLMDKSLVVVAVEGEERRYRLLEPVRQYALERLVEREEERATRERHAAHFLALAAEAYQGVRGPEQLIWSERLDREHDNLRAALAWALERGDIETVAGLAWGLWLYWFYNGHLGEGRRWMEAALARGVPMSERVRGRLLFVLGTMMFAQGDNAAALPILAESRECFRQLGDLQGQAYAIGSQGLAQLSLHRYERGMALLDEAIELFRQSADRWGAVVLLVSAAAGPRQLGDYARSKRMAREGLAIAREIGDRPSMYIALYNLAAVAHAEGDYALATSRFAEALTLSVAMRDTGNAAHCLHALGVVAAARGAPTLAVRLWGAAETVLGSAEGANYPHAADRSLYEESVAATRARLGAPEWDALWDEGRRLSVEEARAAALG